MAPRDKPIVFKCSRTRACERLRVCGLAIAQTFPPPPLLLWSRSGSVGEFVRPSARPPGSGTTGEALRGLKLAAGLEPPEVPPTADYAREPIWWPPSCVGLSASGSLAKDIERAARAAFATPRTELKLQARSQPASQPARESGRKTVAKRACLFFAPPPASRPASQPEAPKTMLPSERREHKH